MPATNPMLATLDEDLVIGRDEIESAERQLRARTSHKRADEATLLYNRLQTIFYDAAFVESVSSLYKHGPNNIPLYANLRCGLWYSPNFEGTPLYNAYTTTHVYIHYIHAYTHTRTHTLHHISLFLAHTHTHTHTLACARARTYACDA